MNLIELAKRAGEWIRYGWDAAGDLVTVATMGGSEGCEVHKVNVEVFSGACEKAVEIGRMLVL